jgi:hypothetical protein
LRPLGAGGDHDRHEIEAVAVDDEAPRAAAGAARGVVREELVERGGPELDGAPALAARAGQELLAEVEVADDEDVRGPGHTAWCCRALRTTVAWLRVDRARPRLVMTFPTSRDIPSAT